MGEVGLAGEILRKELTPAPPPPRRAMSSPLVDLQLCIVLIRVERDERFQSVLSATNSSTRSRNGVKQTANQAACRRKKSRMAKSRARLTLVKYEMAEMA